MKQTLHTYFKNGRGERKSRGNAGNYTKTDFQHHQEGKGNKKQNTTKKKPQHVLLEMSTDSLGTEGLHAFSEK